MISLSPIYNIHICLLCESRSTFAYKVKAMNTLGGGGGEGYNRESDVKIFIYIRL